MNTRPKRQEGTYQAPEVKLAENVFNQSSHLTPDQRGIGRKSDIWSFGCILAEVLAFSQGRDKLVREFSKARRQNARDNYFYSEKLGPAPQYLAAAENSKGPPKEYEVRPTAISWLDGLCNRTASPSKWVDCYVGTIKEILIVDTQKRPDATELLKLLRHVKEHVRHSRDGGQTLCPILDTKVEGIVSTAQKQSESTSSSTPNATRAFQIPRKAIGNANPVSEPHLATTPHSSHGADPNANIDTHDADEFKFVRQTTFEDEVIHTVKGHRSSLRRMEPVEEDDSQLSAPSTNTDLPDTETSTACPSHDDESDARPGPTPIQSQDPEIYQQNTKSSGHRSTFLTSFAKPAYAYGIMIDRAVAAGGASSSIHLPFPDKASHKIVCMAITSCEDGGVLACLTKNAVYLYMLGAESLLAKFYKKILLPGQGGWTGISIAGHFMAVWGFSGGKLVSRFKFLHFSTNPYF
jgi:serine/threonine protein kinase